ncbi:MAG: hypothetical protein V3V20_08185 [Algisphaera sp.]
MSAFISTLGRATAWLDDRINPIMVKELRQAVKSRFVVSVLLFMLIVLVITLLLFVINSPHLGTASNDDGGDLFMIFQATLLGLCMLFVPLYVGARLAAERSSDTSDLLYVTTIRPSSIVWGKLVTGMAIAGLFFAVCVPFMVVTYLLRGIDPPTILFVLAIDLGVVLSSAMLAIFIGALPVGWPVKVLLGFIMAGASFMTYIGISSVLMWEILTTGIGSSIADPEFWWSALGMGTFWLSLIGLFFFLAVAMISPATSNRALPLRLYITVAWVISLGVFVEVSRRVSPGGGEPMTAWAMGWAYVLLPAMVLATSERDVLGPRIKRAIPRNGLLRMPAFLLYSGAGAGLLWATGLFALTLVAAQLSGAWLEGSSLPFGHAGDYHAWRFFSLIKLGVTGLFVLGYALLGVLLRRMFFRGRPKLETSTAAVVLAIMAVAIVVPVIIAYLMSPRHWDQNEELWLILSPFGPLAHRGLGGSFSPFDFVLLCVAGSLALFGLLVNARWFTRQISAFQPLSTKPDAKQEAAPSAPPTMPEATDEASHG